MDYIYKNTEKEKTILVLPGRLDAITYEQFEEIILKLFEEKGRGLVLDFTNVDYVSSAGLRALMRGVKKMRDTGGAMALSGLQADVMHVFRISGFDILFEIVETEEEALVSVKQQLNVL